MKRVLLVEDSELIRNIVCDALQTCFPCVTTVVSDGAQALEELNRNPYDLVVTDIMMPVMDGITLTQKIRGELDSLIPVVMMTSLDQDRVRESASQAGANAFVAKPVDYHQLIQVISNLVLPDIDDEPEELPEIEILLDEEAESEE